MVSQLLVKWVASSPLARARWSEATEVGYPSLIRDKKKEAVKQYAYNLFPAPDLIGLLMDLNVPKLGFRHVSEYMSRRGSAYTRPQRASRSAAPIVVDRCVVFLCILHCYMAIGRLQVAFIETRFVDLPKKNADAVQPVLYRARTVVKLGATGEPDGEEAHALFLAWEELGPLLGYVPEDGE